jgi:hypothetical protein
LDEQPASLERGRLDKSGQNELLAFCAIPNDNRVNVKSRPAVIPIGVFMTMTKQFPAGLLVCFLAPLAIALQPSIARADLLELVNGDHYSGVVIQLTRTNLEFQSEMQGLVKFPRDRIAKITLREPIAKPATSIPATNSSTTTNSAVSADAVIQQMRAQGVDPNMMNQIQQQILGQSNPEATRMFNNTMNGLMSGSINVEDIRVQARKAIKDIQDARKDLGGDSATTELLNGYMDILQKFVSETDTATPTTAATTANAPVKSNVPAPTSR